MGKQEGEEDSIGEAASQVEDHQCSMNSLGVGGLPPVKQCPLFNWARCLRRFKLFLQPYCGSVLHGTGVFILWVPLRAIFRTQKDLKH